MNRIFQGFVFGCIIASSSATNADFKPEAIGIIETLPERYPDHWVMVQDMSFFHMLEGAVRVMDPSEETVGEQYKGQMTSSFIGSFEHSQKRNEHYVIESFFSRGGRGGERTDVVTIYDPITLSVTQEIEIPTKRMTGMVKGNQTALIGDDRFLGIYNFTPAQSVSIVDLEKRIFVNEVATEGCGFVIPNGARSFSSICSDGSFLTSNLDASGGLIGSTRTEAMFDPIGDPVFEAPVAYDENAYFLSFSGKLLPVNIGEKQVSAGDWLSLAVTEDEKSWRPGGITPMTSDTDGNVYILMHPEGGEGTHKNGGSEVWVYDLEKKKRTNRIKLENWSLVVGTSGSGKNKFLLTTNTDMAIDVYELPTSNYARTLTSAGSNPFVIDGLN